MKNTLYALAMLAAGGGILTAGIPGNAIGAGANTAPLEASQTDRAATGAHYQQIEWNPRSRWRCWWRNGERWCGWW